MLGRIVPWPFLDPDSKDRLEAFCHQTPPRIGTVNGQQYRYRHDFSTLQRLVREQIDEELPVFVSGNLSGWRLHSVDQTSNVALLSTGEIGFMKQRFNDPSRSECLYSFNPSGTLQLRQSHYKSMPFEAMTSRDQPSIDDLYLSSLSPYLNQGFKRFELDMRNDEITGDGVIAGIEQTFCPNSGFQTSQFSVPVGVLANYQPNPEIDPVLWDAVWEGAPLETIEGLLMAGGSPFAQFQETHGKTMSILDVARAAAHKEIATLLGRWACNWYEHFLDRQLSNLDRLLPVSLS